MSDPRKPASFRLPRQEPSAEPPARAPRATSVEQAVAVPSEHDPFDTFDDPAAPPPPVTPRRGSRLASILLAAAGTLIWLGVYLWVERLIRELFERAEWLGWAAGAVAAIGAAALVIILAREILALARLASVERLREQAADALERNDARAARAVVDDLTGLVSGRPETAAGRRALAGLKDEIIDGADLVRLAETEILAPLDQKARTLVLDAAKRVSLVTAVSPRALVDVAYVVFEAGRLIRRLSALYGGRPGTLGFFRLARSVLAHLAVTGSMAAGDSLVQQLVGHGIAARLSAKLGEGIVNGMMTARIGIAAMEAARPLPFAAVRRPGMGDFLSALTSFAARRKDAE